jgi:hypothetical protein
MATQKELDSLKLKAVIIKKRLVDIYGQPSAWPIELRTSIAPLVKIYPASTAKVEIDNMIKKLEDIERKWYFDKRKTMC